MFLHIGSLSLATSSPGHLQTKPPLATQHRCLQRPSIDSHPRLESLSFASLSLPLSTNSYGKPWNLLYKQHGGNNQSYVLLAKDLLLLGNSREQFVLLCMPIAVQFLHCTQEPLNNEHPALLMKTKEFPFTQKVLCSLTKSFSKPHLLSP